ncbi:MAG: hypothetical protein II643_06465, partial [Oscillospiraceae bacterium]|nr:hypothetical protein [Oscillospiraceae bacterium]
MIWLTPFYVNQPAGYHGYHTENYNHVDPRFAYGEKIEDKNVWTEFSFRISLSAYRCLRA